MKILLVEDEVSLAKALKKLLINNKHTVDVVHDGQDALDYIEADDYDLILLDIMIPKINGLEVLKNIRNSKNRVPVIMLTAKSELDDKVVGLDIGADDYITKPFEFKELLARIRAVSRRNTDESSKIISYGNIKLDTSLYNISNGDKTYSLNNKEYQILYLLMKRENQIISSEVIFEKIWGYDSDVDNNNVWVNISYLRKKLKKLNANVKIVVKRNLGYTLEMIV